MTTPREQAVAELRRSIDVLPERTRKAMLIGLGNNTVITGAFSGRRRRLPDARGPSRGRAHAALLVPRGLGHVHRRRRAPDHPSRDGVRGPDPAPRDRGQPRARGAERARAAIAEHQASVEARRQEAAIAEQRRVEQETPAADAPPPPAHHGRGALDLSEAIAEHKSTARSAAAARPRSPGWTGCSRRRSCCPTTSARAGRRAGRARVRLRRRRGAAHLLAPRARRSPRSGDGRATSHERPAGRVARRRSPGRRSPGVSDSSIRTAATMSDVWIIASGGTCSLTKSVIGVSTNPGHSAVDLMPSAPSSLFIACVKPTTPNFVAE